jgi:iron(III) transport system permease protein
VDRTPANSAKPVRLLFQDPALVTSVVILWALLGLFVLYPLVWLLLRTFTEGGTLTVANLLAILKDPNHRQSFWNSLLLAALVGVAGTGLGFFFAFTAVRANLSKAWGTVLDAACLLPLISPPFTTAIAMIFSFGPRGLITYHLLGIKGFTVYGLGSTWFSETLTFFPIAYLTLKPILSGIDPNVEDMAFSLGSSRWRVFRTVTMPLTVPGLANAFLLLFAASLADFATPLILAGNQFPVLPTQAYLQITGLFDLKGGAVLSFVLLVPAMIVYVLQRYWVSRKSYVTITGKVGAQTMVKSVAPWARYPLLGVCLLLAGAILYFYLLLFYASVVMALGANHAWTLQHYRVIFTEGLKAIRDTLIIAGAGMPLGGLFGILVGYLVVKKEFPGRQTMEVVSMVNYSLPGTIVGIAYLMAFNDPPLVLTGTALVIVPDGDPRDRRDASADRSQHRGGVAEPGGGERNDVPKDHAAVDLAGVLRRPGRGVHPVHDRDQRHDLPGIHQLDSDNGPDPGEHHRAVSGAGGGVLCPGGGDRLRGHRLDRSGAAAIPRGGSDRSHEYSWRLR